MLSKMFVSLQSWSVVGPDSCCISYSESDSIFMFCQLILHARVIPCRIARASVLSALVSLPFKLHPSTYAPVWSRVTNPVPLVLSWQFHAPSQLILMTSMPGFLHCISRVVGSVLLLLSVACFPIPKFPPQAVYPVPVPLLDRVTHPWTLPRTFPSKFPIL